MLAPRERNGPTIFHAMYLKLTVLGGPQDGLDVSIDALPLMLGREGDQRMPVVDRWASRHHCELVLDDGRLVLHDLSSKHGTFVNGERVDRRELAAGDRVMVGLTTFVVREFALVEEPIASGELPIDRPSGAAA
jgi:pSer/pThr/pTyr-binding forkhead associated (FHA) protein